MTAAELKASILDLAVRGQLVPQREEERFERFERFEKFEGFERFEKSTVDDPPYELPRNWVWKRLGDLVDYGSCENAESEDIDPNAWVLDLEEIEKDTGRLLVRARARDKKVKSTKHIFKKGVVLYSKLRTYLNKVLVADEDGFCTSEIIPLPFPSYIDPEFARRVLMSPMFLAYAESKGYGQKMPRFGSSDAKKAPFPLPPLAEQKRIVAKIEELLPLVEEYGAAQKELETLNADFPAALRESILQDAVRGKLTAEWRRARFEKFEKFEKFERFEKFEKFEKFETARELLDQIAAEKKRLLTAKKIKKEKPLPPITDDEKPFEIPDTWAWCRLGEICSKIGAGATPKGGSNVYVSRGIKLLREQNVHDDGLHLDNVVFITKEANDAKPGSQVRAKDILVNITGASIGRNALVPDDFDVANVNQHVLIVRLVDLSLRHYIHESLRSSAVLNQMFDKQTGDKPGLSAEKVKAFLIPLPPLAEQKAIVERVDELLKIVDAMKAQ